MVVVEVVDVVVVEVVVVDVVVVDVVDVDVVEVDVESGSVVVVAPPVSGVVHAASTMGDMSATITARDFRLTRFTCPSARY